MLPTTSFSILGLLTFGETSGYDLTKLVNQSVGFFWAPAKSQIYAELRRLVSLGYATEREVEQRDRPDKRLYRITRRGQDALRDWLENSEDEPETYKSPFLVKVFFGHLMSRETFVRRMQGYRRECEEQLATFREIERQLMGNEGVVFPYFVLKSGLAHSRAGIRWADQVLRELAKEERA